MRKLKKQNKIFLVILLILIGWILLIFPLLDDNLLPGGYSASQWATTRHIIETGSFHNSNLSNPLTRWASEIGNHANLIEGIFTAMSCLVTGQNSMMESLELKYFFPFFHLLILPLILLSWYKREQENNKYISSSMIILIFFIAFFPTESPGYSVHYVSMTISLILIYIIPIVITKKSRKHFFLFIFLYLIHTSFAYHTVNFYLFIFLISISLLFGYLYRKKISSNRIINLILLIIVIYFIGSLSQPMLFETPVRLLWTSLMGIESHQYISQVAMSMYNPEPYSYMTLRRMISILEIFTKIGIISAFLYIFFKKIKNKDCGISPQFTVIVACIFSFLLIAPAMYLWGGILAVIGRTEQYGSYIAIIAAILIIANKKPRIKKIVCVLLAISILSSAYLYYYNNYGKDGEISQFDYQSVYFCSENVNKDTYIFTDYSKGPALGLFGHRAFIGVGGGNQSVNFINDFLFSIYYSTDLNYTIAENNIYSIIPSYKYLLLFNTRGDISLPSQPYKSPSHGFNKKFDVANNFNKIYSSKINIIYSHRK